MNQDPGNIRPARELDASAISACVAAAYHHYIERIGKPPGPMLDDYVEVIRLHHVFVLVEETEIIGVLVLIRYPDFMLLDNVAVHPAHQGRGLGTRLLTWAEKETQALGFGRIMLYTNEAMTENLDLYTKLGYIETVRKFEKGYRRIYMHKDLGPTHPAGPA